MDSFDDDPFEPSPSTSRNEKAEAAEALHQLLEEGWFFGKFLNSKPRMLRCYSDPSPNVEQEVLAKNPYSEKSSSTRKVTGNNLTRGPSLPPCIGREEQIKEEERNSTGMSKLRRQLSDQMSLAQKPTKPTCIQKKSGVQKKASNTSFRSNIITQKSSPAQRSLRRTPSLPPCIGREEVIAENESEITMSRLIRQVMPNSLDILPKSQNLMGMPKLYRPQKNLEVESIDHIACPKKPRQSHRCQNHRTLKKSLSDLEFQEVQGFKDLGFTFDKHLNPSVVDILPGLQEDKKDFQYQRLLRRPHLSEAWHAQNCACAPPISLWAAKNSEQDMKEQLKFWARAVASNVR